MWNTVLFDLDGTLTDPKEGITKCVKYALDYFGVENSSLDELEVFIGPPLKEQFMAYCGFNDEMGFECVKKYRERFETKGIFENKIYTGIEELLQALKKEGITLAVASSKPTVYVLQILKHFDIYKYFDVVMGSELDGRRTDKSQVIKEVLEIIKPKSHNDVVMVGDRCHDIIGANKNHIHSIGVAYGYGGIEELKECGAEYIAKDVSSIKSLLLI